MSVLARPLARPTMADKTKAAKPMMATTEYQTSDRRAKKVRAQGEQGGLPKEGNLDDGDGAGCCHLIWISFGRWSTPSPRPGRVKRRNGICPNVQHKPVPRQDGIDQGGPVGIEMLKRTVVERVRPSTPVVFLVLAP